MGLRILGLLLVLSVQSAAYAKSAEARVDLSGVGRSCYDGDTCTIIYDSKPLKIRFYGIDAPEFEQKHGRQAQAFTESLVREKRVDMKCRGESFDRLVCTVYQAGRNINSEVVRYGWAFDFPLFSKGQYRSLEQAAQERRRGIWADEKRLVSPFCFRHPTERACRDDKLFMP